MIKVSLRRGHQKSISGMFLKIKVERSIILIPVKGNNKVEDHYTRSNLRNIILLELQKAGRDINALTLEDI